MNEGRKRGCLQGCLGALSSEAPPCKAPVQLMCTQQLSAHTEPLCPSLEAVVWSLSPAAKPCHGGGRFNSQSTRRLGVWSDATRLASCHLFLGLLNTRQVKHPCLEDATFLETTGKLERGGAVGFPAQEPEVPSDQKPGTNSTRSPLCSLLARLFCLIQPKPLLFCVYVSQHNICPDTKYTNTVLRHIPRTPQTIPCTLQIPHNTVH